jgi:hypothetical protein
MAALARDLSGVFVGLAMSAAVFLIGHAGTGGMGTFLLISHKLSYLLRDFSWEILEVGCNNAFSIWQARNQTPQLWIQRANSCHEAVGPTNRVICPMKIRNVLPNIVAR